MAGRKPQAWLLITRLALWRQFKAEGEWAFHKYSMPRASEIRPGDLGFVYLTKENARKSGMIVAVVRDTGRLSMGGSTSLAVQEFYPYKLAFHLVADLVPVIPFPDLVPRLEFIKRKERYGVYLQGKSAIRLSENDAAVLATSVSGSMRGSGQRRELLPLERREIAADG